MNRKKTDMHKEIDVIEVFIILFYNVLMLFYKTMGSIIALILGVLFLLWFINRRKNKWSLFQRMIFLVCIYVPTSFISIIGTEYGHLPLTWFNLILIIIYILILLKGVKKSFYLYSPLIFIIFGLILAFNTDIIDVLKQLLTITLFIISFIIGEYIGENASNEFINRFKKLYLLSVFSFSITVFIQRFCGEYLNIRLGHYEVIGQNRIVSAGLMNDYSFATLYLATAGVIIMIDYIDKRIISTLKFLLAEIYIIFTILKVNSRTGLFAMGIVSVIYLSIKLIQRKYKAIIILICGIMALPIIFNLIIQSRGGQEILDSSGRISLIGIAIDVFYKHPFLGIGLGVNRWRNATGVVLPHNILFQYLAQLGIVGSLLFYSNIGVLIKKYLRYRSEFFWVLATVFIGAMAIPDIVSSRFLSVLIILTIASSKNLELKKKIKEGYNEKG